MSIFKVETEAFTYLSNMMQSYGIPVEFRYDENLNVLDEFRKSVQFRIQNQNTFNALINGYLNTSDPNDPNSPNPNAPPSKMQHNFGLYNRTAVRRSTIIGNNMQWSKYVKVLNDDYGIELRDYFQGEIDYTITMVFDTHEMGDIFELLYVNGLEGKQKQVLMDYILGENVESLEDVPYSLQFQPISSIGTLGNSPTLRTVSFGFNLSGPFFLPFYENSYRLETIVLSAYVMPKGTEITPENATDANKFYSTSVTMPINPVETDSTTKES